MVQGRHHQHFHQKPHHFEIQDQCYKTAHYNMLQNMILRTSLIGCVGAAFLFLLPVLYFLYQNYDLFQKMTLSVQPDLLEHLRRELTTLTFFWILSLVGTTSAVWYVNKKILGPIIKTTAKVDAHIQKVISTGVLQIEDFQGRQADDEFSSLPQSYVRLLTEFEKIASRDIELINSFKNESKFSESNLAIKSLLSQKRKMVGQLSVVDRGVKSFESVGRRSAS